jgi:hypothetical protein
MFSYNPFQKLDDLTEYTSVECHSTKGNQVFFTPF